MEFSCSKFTIEQLQMNIHQLLMNIVYWIVAKEPSNAKFKNKITNVPKADVIIPA